MSTKPEMNEQEFFERVRRDVQDELDEELEMEFEDLISAEMHKLGLVSPHPQEVNAANVANFANVADVANAPNAASIANTVSPREERQRYFRELVRLQGELIKLQDWVVANRRKVVILFEGRDAAGKGGVIKRITQRMNPRVARTVALPAPNDRERTQWYFQRYVHHLPAAGEIVLFDRSWYNRAGVERVMGFCTDEEYEEFFRTVPEFEKMLIRSGIQLIKYWFSITDEEQEFRFKCRIYDPLKQWKLSPMDLESRRRWEDYTRAKEVMLARTHIPEAPWWVVQAVDKKKARLNCIHHLLSQFQYASVPHEQVVLPQRVHHDDYARHPLPAEMIVPQVF